MTAIVALVENTKIWMAGDSASSNGHFTLAEPAPKVFVKKDMIIGFTTSFRMGQLLQYEFTPPENNRGNVREYMVRDFVQAVRDCFVGGGFQKKKDERVEGGNFLVGYKGRLFEIYDDYQVSESSLHYHACGCGREVALGAMFAQQPSIGANERLIKALEAASYYCAGVRKPFYVESLESCM